MTEAEWLASKKPNPMVEWVRDLKPSRPAGWQTPSDRKMRLFACACVRQFWHLLTDRRSRRAVEVAERFADGEASDRQLSRAFEAGAAVFMNNPDELGRKYGQKAAEADAYMCCQTDVARMLTNLTADRPGMPRPPQAALLRE